MKNNFLTEISFLKKRLLLWNMKLIYVLHFLISIKTIVNTLKEEIYDTKIKTDDWLELFISTWNVIIIIKTVNNDWTYKYNIL